MPHQIYEQPVRIHFGDCDPAGIVYHPSYFRLLNMLHEDFLQEVAGVGFIEIRKYGVGFPLVGVRTDFVAPSRPGDVLEGRVWLEKLGASSVRFALTLSKNGELRVKCVQTMVCVKLNDAGDFVKSEIPANIRGAFTAYLVEPGDPLLEFRG